MYAKIDGSTIVKYPYTFKDLQKDHSNVSFPKTLNATVKAAYNVADVNENAKPDYDPLTEEVVEAAMTVVDGVAQRNFAKQDLSSSVKAENIRRARTDYLKNTDYLALSDVVMSDEWKSYRQELRDIPEQAGFPDNVSWPTAPE